MKLYIDLGQLLHISGRRLREAVRGGATQTRPVRARMDTHVFRPVTAAPRTLVATAAGAGHIVHMHGGGPVGHGRLVWQAGGDVATLLVHSGLTSPKMVAQLRLGVTLPGGRAQPCPGFAALSLATLLGCLSCRLLWEKSK